MSEPAYREVQKISELSSGDHIAWRRTAGYYHHAIVEWVKEDQGHVSVIHFSGDVRNKDSVRAELIRSPFAPSEGPLFIVEHQQTLPVKYVIERANSRLGERGWTPFNNCEHFANWCKIGEKECHQLTTIKNVVVKHVVLSVAPAIVDVFRNLRDMATEAVKKCEDIRKRSEEAYEQIKKIAKSELSPYRKKFKEVDELLNDFSTKNLGEFAKKLEATRDRYTKLTKQLGQVFAAATIIIEIILCLIDVHKLWGNFKNGVIYTATFATGVLKRIARCVGAAAAHLANYPEIGKISAFLSNLSVSTVVNAAATTAGSYGGNVIGGIIGTAIGGPVGGYIGMAVGAYAGKAIGATVGSYAGPAIETVGSYAGTGMKSVAGAVVGGAMGTYGSSCIRGTTWEYIGELGGSAVGWLVSCFS